MKLIQRVGYYLGGFSIGLIFLAFFLSGKRVSCSYGPNARVIKNINLKPLKYSENSLRYIKNKNIDTSLINNVLKNGNVNFSLSNTKLDSCKIYIIEKSEIILTVKNCDSLATLKEVAVK